MSDRIKCAANVWRSMWICCPQVSTIDDSAIPLKIKIRDGLEAVQSNHFVAQLFADRNTAVFDLTSDKGDAVFSCLLRTYEVHCFASGGASTEANFDNQRKKGTLTTWAV